MSDPAPLDTRTALRTANWLYPDHRRRSGGGFRQDNQGHPPESATVCIGKSDAFKEAGAAGAFRHQTPTRAWWQTRFKPGHKTWNKGVKGSVGLHENCRKTQFQPGQKPNT